MSRRRRTRFTVTCSHVSSDEIERKVILAYDAPGAQGYYEERGYTVLRVQRGDYRAEIGQTWKIDREALAAAIELLDIKLPVKIRFNSRVGKTAGNYRFHECGYHDIMLKTYRTAAEASATLWHELTHAMQAERFQRANPHLPPRTAWLAQLEQSHGKYRACPMEIEANRMAADTDDLPLVVSL